ncbi:cytochrome d ubiquinol oxidase subunit II [Peribacillus sp. V2I11]|uniref:cytochrome d ubiquinol oxidase subunit II n=1 Tax=Peribacillus sp. V2I11 TaxID=3042277 RepID=UPI00277EFB8D|nr:cytochrome d ubiquinol oxidase subunit II [Peribacillus sp. V2I11]MDQ0884291.1 cytochrome d ubiquinol oxidase subunit II [Peribacillus sp. V2I11]
MSNALLAITLVWGFIFLYAIMASMDFGAGFWAMTYIKKEETNATKIANSYLSPTWEVTNTFVVGLVIAIYSLFPGAVFPIGVALIVPASLILVLLCIRSAFLVFSHSVDKYEKALTYISGLTGLIIPGLLISVLPITHLGFVEGVRGNEELNLSKLFTSPNEYAFVGFGIMSTLFLSSLLLSDYSKQADEMKAYKIYRRDAMITGPLMLVMALLVMLTLKNEANWIYQGMMENSALLFVSLVFFIISGIALYLPYFSKQVKGMPRLAVIAIIIQYLIGSYVYGIAHLPYIIYPNVTILSGFTDPTSFRAVFATYIVGFAILVPGFYYFWSIFMKDQRRKFKRRQMSN